MMSEDGWRQLSLVNLVVIKINRIINPWNSSDEICKIYLELLSFWKAEKFKSFKLFLGNNDIKT